MNKFVVVGNPTLAEQMGAVGREATSVPANASFGLVMGRIASLGDPSQVVLVCTAERSDLALTALPYVGLSIVTGSQPSEANDGVLRIAPQDAAAVLAAVQQYGMRQSSQPPQHTPMTPQPPQHTPMTPQPPQHTPMTPQSSQPPQHTPMTQQPPQPGHNQRELSRGAVALPASGNVDYAPSAVPDFLSGEYGPSPGAQQAHTAQPAQAEVAPTPQASPTMSAAPTPQASPTMSKAQFEETTYDPTFKSAPWASQVTDPSSPHGLIVGVTAAKGGAGKSTLTCWLSEALTACGVSVALVDANIGQPDIAKMTGTWGRSPGIAALAGERRFSDNELFDAALDVDGLGLVLGGPAKPLEETPEPMLAAMALAVERLAAHYEFVIVDTPVGTVYEPVFGRFVLHVANILLVVTNPHQPTVHDTVLWVDAMSKPPEEGGFGWPRDKTIGVLNRSDPNTDLNLEIVRSWAPNLDILCDVPEVEGVIAAVNNGEWRCPQTARESVANLAQQLCQTHPSITDPLTVTSTETDTTKKAKVKTKKQRKSGLMKRLRGR